MKTSLFAIVAVAGSLSLVDAVQAQVINQTVPGHSPQREATLAPFRAAAERMRNFESARLLSAYSPAERQRAIRKAESLLAASHTSCDVVNAAQVGQTERRRDIVEVACSNGYGYILVDGSTPAAFDCLQIAQAAAAVRRDDPRADVGSQCTLNENGG